jgi:hypothetical protein
MLLGPVTPTCSSRFYIEYSFKENIMAKQQGKLTLAQKQAASAAANKAHLKNQQAGANQPVETALSAALRAAQQTQSHETVTVTVTAETTNGNTVTSREALVSPEPTQEPVPTPAAEPAHAPATDTEVVKPVTTPVSTSVSAPVLVPPPVDTPAPASVPAPTPVSTWKPIIRPASESFLRMCGCI